MNSKTKGLLLVSFLGAALIATVILFYFYKSALRVHVLTPLIEAYYVGRYYLDFVPQLYLWVIPPLLFGWIMMRRLVRISKHRGSTTLQRNSFANPSEGELARLTHQVHQARYSRFARVRLSRTLVEVSTRLIAGREGMSLMRARQLLARDYWHKHSSIHRFLTPRRHYTARQSGEEFQQLLEDVIVHLEEFADYV